MRRLTHQQGYTLVIVLGILATVAILTGALVMVMTNVQGGTADDRTKTKSFDVAEAGLDYAVFAMGTTWPASAESFSFDGSNAGSFAAAFPDAEYPKPSSEIFATVVVYDNPPYTSPHTASNPPSYDMNGDGIVWLESQGNVGKRSSRIRTQVMQQTVGLTTLAPGVAVYTAGHLQLTGNSEFSGPIVNGQPTASVQVYKNVTGSGNLNMTAAPMKIRGGFSYSGNVRGSKTTGDTTVGPFSQYMPDAVITSLTNSAKSTPSNGTKTPPGGGNLTFTGNNNVTYTTPIYVDGDLVFNGNQTVTAPAIYVTGSVRGSGNTKIDIGGMYVGGSWNTTGNLSLLNLGPTYVNGNVSMKGNDNWKMPLLVSGGVVTLSGNTAIGGNGVGSNRPPAIVYAANGIAWNGNGAFWGLLSTKGTFSGNGNGKINGQVIVQGNMTPTGNFNVAYDSNVNGTLRTNATTAAKIVPDTWQEIQPE